MSSASEGVPLMDDVGEKDRRDGSVKRSTAMELGVSAPMRTKSVGKTVSIEGVPTGGISVGGISGGGISGGGSCATNSRGGSWVRTCCSEACCSCCFWGAKVGC